MSLDFSHLYKQETIELDMVVGDPLQVTVREIPHGEYVALQKEMLGTVSLASSKRELQRQFESKTLDAMEFSDRQALIGIASWTLKDSKGDDVPVSLEAWRALPHWLTERIEEAIDKLNPDLDEEFQE